MSLPACPFCGRMNTVRLSESTEDDEDLEPSYAVVCDFTMGGCGASGGYAQDEDEAIAAWSQRA